jgi:hypothetical protein
MTTSAPTTGRRFGSVRRHKNRWQARYLNPDGRAVARNWPSEDAAWAWLEWIEARRYRWPLGDLHGLVSSRYETHSALARAIGVQTTIVDRAAERGLSDAQADGWAVRLGYHPMSVWGWAWIDAALEVYPGDTDDGTATEAVA